MAVIELYTKKEYDTVTELCTKKGRGTVTELYTKKGCGTVIKLQYFIIAEMRYCNRNNLKHECGTVTDVYSRD